MSDHDHHDHPLPPPEPDNIPLGQVVFWGVASFVATLAVIFALGSYFWMERDAEDVSKVHGTTMLGQQSAELDAQTQQRLSKIEEAMEKLSKRKEIK